MIDVSVVIVNYKTAELIRNCVNSILAHTKDVEYEIIVVDNNSGDDSETMLTKWFPRERIVYVGLDENVGFGRANNKGFEKAKGRNVLCLNPDTLLLNNAIKILSDCLDANDDIAVCGGNLYDENMRPALSYKRFLPSILWDLNILFFSKLELVMYGRNRQFNHTGKLMDVGYITGADLMAKKSVLDEMHGYSPDFFMYYEETDLCCRIKQRGYRIVNVPDAKIQHLEGKSFSYDGVNIKGLAYSEKGRKVYYEKHIKRVERCVAEYVYTCALYLNKYTFRLLGNKAWMKYDCRIKILREQRKS